MTSASHAPTVSVVIPCYNAERWVGETLESVLTQEGVDYEVIVVDDGSTDASVRAVAAYAPRFDGRLVHITGPNRGASAARNLGMARARGRYVQYLDADDLLVPGTLARRVEALRGAPDCSVAVCGWQELHVGADGLSRLGPDHECADLGATPRDAEIALFTDAWQPPAALLYSRAAVDRIGAWNVGLEVIQDARYAFDAALEGAAFVRVHGVGCQYRIHGETSLSRRNPIRFATDVLLNAQEIEQRWTREGGIDETRSAALKRVYSHAASALAGADPARFAASRAGLLRHGGDAPFSVTWVRWTLGRLVGQRVASWAIRTLRASRLRDASARR